MVLWLWFALRHSRAPLNQTFRLVSPYQENSWDPWDGCWALLDFLPSPTLYQLQANGIICCLPRWSIELVCDCMKAWNHKGIRINHSLCQRYGVYFSQWKTRILHIEKCEFDEARHIIYKLTVEQLITERIASKTNKPGKKYLQYFIPYEISQQPPPSRVRKKGVNPYKWGAPREPSRRKGGHTHASTRETNRSPSLRATNKAAEPSSRCTASRLCQVSRARPMTRYKHLSVRPDAPASR